MMGASTERVVDKVIKYGAVFAEVRPLKMVLLYGNQRKLTPTS